MNEWKITPWFLRLIGKPTFRTWNRPRRRDLVWIPGHWTYSWAPWIQEKPAATEPQLGPFTI